MSPSLARTRTADLFDRVSERVTAGRLLPVVVVAVWAWLYLAGLDLAGLGELPLRVWDESRYATPARHMVRSGNWLDPMIRVNTHSADLGLDVRLNKPPLGYWLQAAAMSLLGVTEFAARLPTALATLGCAGLVYRVGGRTRDRRAGFAGALLFLAFPGMLLGSHGGRAAVLDTLLALFGSAFVWFTWRGRDRPRLLVPAGVAAGLAVMTKGVAAGVFVVVVLPVVALSLRSYLTRWTAAAVASTFVVALPWHVYAWVAHGREFVREYFLVTVASRVQGELDARETEPLLDFMNYPWFQRAFSLFVPPYRYALPVFGTGLVVALALVCWRVRRDGADRHRDELLLVWWLVAVPLTFVLGGGNHPWYLLPMYVPGAVLLGLVPAALADGTLGRAVRDAASDTRLEPAARRLLEGVRGVDRALTAVRGLGPRARAAAYPVLCVAFVIVLVTTYAAPLAEPYNGEQRSIGTEVSERTPGDATVYVWLGPDGERESIMTLSFYADRSLERATPERLDADPEIRYAIVPLGERSRLERQHRVVAEGPKNDIVVVAFGVGSTA